MQETASDRLLEGDGERHANMTSLHMRGRPLAFLWAFLLSECVLTAEGADPGRGFDLKYILIGGGIGLFLVAVFITTKICMIRRQILETSSVCSFKKSEHHISQSEHPMEVASYGTQG